MSYFRSDKSGPVSLLRHRTPHLLKNGQVLDVCEFPFVGTAFAHVYLFDLAKGETS
jgi:hypothetical protein